MPRDDREKNPLVGSIQQPDGQISKKLSSPLCKNILVFRSRKSLSYLPSSRPGRGALAIVTNVGAGCGGRGGAFDEQRQCGRRSRVVLTPRRWRQVPGKQASWERRWQESRSPGRSRRKPLKPLRAGMPGDFRCDRWTSRVHFSLPSAHEAAGALGTRHSRTPSLLGGGGSCTTRADRAARTRTLILLSLRGAAATKQSSFLSCRPMDCFACARNDG